ncbi:MAG: hypothetical protein QNJ67_08690 [Kiloniellales bacterium]|nr:hypothetical protein [Kiloniellales bacterium]
MARRLEGIYRELEGRDVATLGPEILALEQEIADSPATGLQEAAIQVMLAAAYVERLREDLVDDTEDALDKMQRLMCSALSAIVRESGVDLDDVGGQRYAPEYQDSLWRFPKPH